MLILEQYGIKLCRVQKEDIELIRKWRNQKCVSEYMEYKKHITRWAQRKWFKKINNKFNYFFIIETEGKKVGVINVKNYNEALGFGEGGIFIGDQNYINSFVSVYSTLCLLNVTFMKLNLKKSVIKILRNNYRAIQYNKLIGYKLLQNQDNVENQLYELTIEDYIKYGARLNKAATILNKNQSTLHYSGIVSDLNIDAINQLLLNNTI